MYQPLEAKETRQDDKFATKKRNRTTQIAHLVFADTQNASLKKLKEQFLSYVLKKNENNFFDLNQFVCFCQIKISHMQTFGEIIKAEREKKGLFLRQVASAMEVDQALISKFEKGDRKPSKEQVEKFADFFELNKDELITAWLSATLFLFDFT